MLLEVEHGTERETEHEVTPVMNRQREQEAENLLQHEAEQGMEYLQEGMTIDVLTGDFLIEEETLQQEKQKARLDVFARKMLGKVTSGTAPGSETITESRNERQMAERIQVYADAFGKERKNNGV